MVQCRVRQEERALEHLERQGFECYRPLYLKERIRLDRIHDNWLPICSTRGVIQKIQIVRFNEYPLPVGDTIVEQIRQRIESQSVREPYLRAGERVVIADGSFSGIEAVFVASDGEERVMLLLSILPANRL
jgi:transcriptional antiterminator RfaH